MITNVSISPIQNHYKSSNSRSVSFGFAKLNSIGRQAADSFGYTQNNFVDGDLFRAAKVFRKPAIVKKLAQGESFLTLCQTYGCSENPKANAEFINNQILSPKSKAAISKVPEAELKDSLILLYQKNYDNPELSLVSTHTLLNRLKNMMPAEEYIQNIGMLKAGVANK